MGTTEQFEMIARKAAVLRIQRTADFMTKNCGALDIQEMEGGGGS